MNTPARFRSCPRLATLILAGFLATVLSSQSARAETWSSGSVNDVEGDSYFGSVLEISGGSNTIHGDEGSGYGSATLTLTGGLLFSGTASPNLTISSDDVAPGILYLQSDVSFTGSSGTASITNGHLLTFNPTTGNSDDSGVFGAIAGKVDLGGATRTFTIADGSNGVDMTIGAQVTNGALTKTGPGLLELSLFNTYAGTTTVSNGTLLVSNVTGSGTGTGNVVVDGGVIGGTGRIAGSMTVNAGGTIAPGASIGSLTIHSLSLTSATSHLALDLDLGQNPDADLLNVTGGISLNGSTLDLSLTNITPAGLPKTFLVAANDQSDPVTGTFGTITGVPNGYTATVNYAYTGTDALGRVGDGNDIAVTVIPVPEPSTAVLLGLALAGMVAARRRRVGTAKNREAC